MRVSVTDQSFEATLDEMVGPFKETRSLAEVGWYLEGGCATGTAVGAARGSLHA
jgi:hypothetical protein